MPLPPLDLTLPTDTLRVVAWPDAVIDQLGHDPRSRYAEKFWLPILGPSTYLFLRQAVSDLDLKPDGYDLPLTDSARALGLGHRGGRNAPFLRAIARSIQFKACCSIDSTTIGVRRRLAPLTRSQVNRLDPTLRDEHDAWSRETVRRPGIDEQRRRARRLALSLAELGEPDEVIEQQLHKWHLHPALAHEALQWARARQQGAPIPPPPPRSIVADPADTPSSETTLCQQDPEHPRVGDTRPAPVSSSGSPTADDAA